MVLLSRKYRKLLPLCAATFFTCAGIGSFTPFITLHMKAIGIEDDEAIIINVTSAFASVAGPVLFGFLAERHSRHRFFFLLSLLFATLGYTSLAFVPKVIRTLRDPMIEFDCPHGLYVERCQDWSSCVDSNLNPRGAAQFRLTDCQINCNGGINTTGDEPIHFCFTNGIERDGLCVVYSKRSASNSSVEFTSSFSSSTASTLTDLNASLFSSYDPEIHAPVVDVCSFDLLAPIIVSNTPYTELHCRPNIAPNCVTRCFATVADSINRQMRAAKCVEVRGDPQITFWATLGLRVFSDLFLLTAVYMLEMLTINCINDYNGLYGRVKFWGALGIAMFATATGPLIDFYSLTISQLDYSPAFLLMDGAFIIALSIVCLLPLGEYRKSSSQYLAMYAYPYHYYKTFCSFEMCLFLLILLFLGTYWGYLETYLHRIYAHLGANHLIIGLSLGLPYAFALPFLAVSKNLIRNIGRSHLVVFGLLFYGTRMGGLSFVSWRWWSMPFEAMETFTMPILWLALVAYGQKLVTDKHRASLQCTLITVHFGVGRGLGALIGYFGNALLGTAWTLRGFGASSVILAVFFLFCYYSCVRPLRRRRKRIAAATRPMSVNGGWYPLDHPGVNGDALRPPSRFGPVRPSREPWHDPDCIHYSSDSEGGFECDASVRSSMRRLPGRQSRI